MKLQLQKVVIMRGGDLFGRAILTAIVGLVSYPPTHAQETVESARPGWYMGRQIAPTIVSRRRRLADSQVARAGRATSQADARVAAETAAASL